MQPLFVFTADLHLVDGAWSTRPGIYGDAYFSFAQIVDYCVTHNLPLVLGGDVLEKKSNSPRPIVKLCQGMDRMKVAGLPVYYIQGNHEYDRNAAWLSVHDWPQHMHKQLININDTLVYGLDWLPKGEIQEAFKTVPVETEALVTHQVWDDFMNGVGRTECTLKDVYYVRTILAGDFHVTKTVEGVGAQGQRIQMLSPGSICMQDCGECQYKQFFVIARDTDNRIHFQQQPLKTRRFLQYQVNSQEMLDSLCAGDLATHIKVAHTDAALDTPEELHKPVVRIKFDKRLPDAFLRLTTAVGDSAHLFCEALPERGQTERTATPSRSSSKNELLDALSDLLGEDTESYKLAAAMVKAEEPSKELDDYFAKFQEEAPRAVTAPRSAELGTSPPPGV